MRPGRWDGRCARCLLRTGARWWCSAGAGRGETAGAASHVPPGVGCRQHGGEWADALQGAAEVVGMAGAPFFRRWKSWEEFERVGTGGRIAANRNLVAAMRRCDQPPGVFVTGSAVGCYGLTGGDQPVSEDSPAGTDRWRAGTTAWEAEAMAVGESGVRVVALRTGIVLSPQEGMAARQRIRRGHRPGQPVTAVDHIADEVGLIRLALSDERVEGGLNAFAPNPQLGRLRRGDGPGARSEGLAPAARHGDALGARRRRRQRAAQPADAAPQGARVRLPVRTPSSRPPWPT